MRIVTVLLAALVAVGCTGAVPAATPSGVAASPAASAGPTPSVPAPSVPSPTPEITRDPAEPFPSGNELAPLPAGTWSANDFVPPFTVVIEEGGWNGISAPGIVVLTRDNGYFTRLWFGRFEGTVMPDHCADGRTAIAADPESLLAWLEDNPALTVQRADVTVGGLPGVRLEITATTRRPCGPDAGKGAPEFLWVEDRDSEDFVHSIDTGETVVAYLLDDGSATVTILLRTVDQPLVPFLELAEPLLDGVSFEAPQG